MTDTDPINRADRDRVAVLTIDCPGRRMNVVDEAVIASLHRHIAAINAETDIVAVVLASAKVGSFGAGADIEWLPKLAARDDADAFLGYVHQLMTTLIDSPKPLVTAIDGAAFGGALELALGGHAILATPETTLGLPEVTLSLLPGGGGTQLLRRFVPAAIAAELLATGAPLDAAAAHEHGIVNRIVGPEELLDQAVRLAVHLAEDPESRQPAEPVTTPDDLAAVQSQRQALSASRQGLSLAAGHILDVVEVGIQDGLVSGLAAERTHFLTLLRSAESRAALHLFTVERDVKRRSGSGAGQVSRLGVVGGGQMGAGIAATAVARGLDATVRDVSDASVARARDYRDKVLARTAPSEGADPRAERWHGTTEWDGFADADAVIEAVFELPELKHEVQSTLGALVGEDTLLATNTSAIPISSLATGVTGPERFIGMHFFSPVDRMPLVELIPHRTTAPTTMQRAAALGRQLGKVPVVVGDAPGFFTSRVYARWLIEGVRLLLDGVPIDRIDDSAAAVGFPVGPLRAIDEATATLVLQASITQVAEPVMAGRLDVGAVKTALVALVAADIDGRRSGEGFYSYDDDGRRAGPNPRVAVVLDLPEDGTIDDEVVAERLLLAFTSECLLCVDDGTLCHPDDGDVAAVLGIGFPRVLGGPFHWTDEIGAAAMVDRFEVVGSEEFPPGTTLRHLARDRGTLRDLPRRPAPFAASAAVTD